MIKVNTSTLKIERQRHLNLREPCLERGGNSTVHKGVLAEFLNTNIPSGRILLCHACHNGKCSNPRHLYWGTDKENKEDYLLNGGKTIWEATVAKYGYQKACEMQGKRTHFSSAGKIGGSKLKTEEHRRNISKSLLSRKKQGRYPAG